MKVSLVLTIFLLLIVAWFVIQSVLIVFEAFFKPGGEDSGGLRMSDQATGKLSHLGPDAHLLDGGDRKGKN
jgi:hypothetical protein